MNARASAAVLSVRRLQVHYPLIPAWPWQAGGLVRAVDDLQFDLRAGETVGITGGVASGKSTIARVIAGRQPYTTGSIEVAGQPLRGRDDAGWAQLQRDLQFVGEAALPAGGSATLGSLIGGHVASIRPELDASVRDERRATLMAEFGLQDVDDKRVEELDPSQRLRASLVGALAPQPRILVWDAGYGEETESALDYLRRYRQGKDLAVVFATRDPELVRDFCDRVLVMFMGRMMEQAQGRELFHRPRHPYTRKLLADGSEEDSATTLSPAAPPSGCLFRVHCEMADAACGRQVPHVRKSGDSHAACLFVSEEAVAASA